MEKFAAVMLIIMALAVCSVFLTGSVVFIYYLVGLIA